MLNPNFFGLNNLLEVYSEKKNDSLSLLSQKLGPNRQISSKYSLKFKIWFKIRIKQITGLIGRSPVMHFYTRKTRILNENEHWFVLLVYGILYTIQNDLNLGSIFNWPKKPYRKRFLTLVSLQIAKFNTVRSLSPQIFQNIENLLFADFARHYCRLSLFVWIPTQSLLHYSWKVLIWSISFDRSM